MFQLGAHNLACTLVTLQYLHTGSHYTEIFSSSAIQQQPKKSDSYELSLQWGSWCKPRHLTQAVLQLDDPQRYVSHKLPKETRAQEAEVVRLIQTLLKPRSTTATDLTTN